MQRQPADRSSPLWRTNSLCHHAKPGHSGTSGLMVNLRFSMMSGLTIRSTVRQSRRAAWNRTPGCARSQRWSWTISTSHEASPLQPISSSGAPIAQSRSLPKTALGETPGAARHRSSALLDWSTGRQPVSNVVEATADARAHRQYGRLAFRRRLAAASYMAAARPAPPRPAIYQGDTETAFE
jgi:hypothetical protein